VYSKKINKKFIFFFLLFFFSFTHLLAKELPIKIKKDILNNLLMLSEFSSDFLQSDGQTTEEGRLFLKKKRIRIDYTKPEKIKIILSKNKAMYLNIDLQEVEYFNPKNSPAIIFYDVFNNNNFFDDADYIQKSNSLMLKKNIMIDDKIIKIKIYFENKPFLLRKLEIYQEDSILSISLYNHNFNPDLEEGYFSMANPIIN
jgi:outer membrane lipoprotein-sorting protein